MTDPSAPLFIVNPMSAGLLDRDDRAFVALQALRYERFVAGEAGCVGVERAQADESAVRVHPDLVRLVLRERR